MAEVFSGPAEHRDSGPPATGVSPPHSPASLLISGISTEFPPKFRRYPRDQQRAGAESAFRTRRQARPPHPEDDRGAQPPPLVGAAPRYGPRTFRRRMPPTLAQPRPARQGNGAPDPHRPSLPPFRPDLDGDRRPQPPPPSAPPTRPSPDGVLRAGRRDSGSLLSVDSESAGLHGADKRGPLASRERKVALLWVLGVAYGGTVREVCDFDAVVSFRVAGCLEYQLSGMSCRVHRFLLTSMFFR